MLLVMPSCCGTNLAARIVTQRADGDPSRPHGDLVIQMVTWKSAWYVQKARW